VGIRTYNFLHRILKPKGEIKTHAGLTWFCVHLIQLVSLLLGKAGQSTGSSKNLVESRACLSLRFVR